MKELKDHIDLGRLPQHIAVIMDGNGRWAKKQGRMRIFGHENGVKAVREVTESCAELGVEYLTLYAFSTENWNRPREEVNALMSLLVSTIHSETDTLMKNGIRLEAIGDIENLPVDCRKELSEAMAITETNNRMTLVLALSYSSRWDLMRAVRHLASEVEAGKLKPSDIKEEHISHSLTTREYPNPDLMIRTSGEHRISNFLLWELAYAEFYFTDTLWPDFRKDDLYKALIDYQNRERRFGKTSEQILT
jgi:undecaprenyl diphosphate synthase